MGQQELRPRKYQSSHPWINFELRVADLDPQFWLLLGQAISKVQHICRVPMKPSVAHKFHQVYLARGVLGTTAIEGNTMSEEEVLAQVKGVGSMPPSRQYQEQAVDNILRACNEVIAPAVRGDGGPPITVATIKEFNRRVLEKLELEEGVVPGEVSAHPVIVGNIYPGAPREDCEYLLDRMCKHIDEIREILSPMYGPISAGVIAAIVAHLYIAWIHPFGDGNGRTARLLELLILVDSGVPTVSAHLLSNHYNITRDKYYARLKDASAAREPERFYQYAIQGFVDGLTQQVEEIHNENILIAWLSYIHDILPDDDGGPSDRKRHLLIDMQKGKIKLTLPADKKDAEKISARLAVAYAGLTDKTMNRDLDELFEKNLLTKEDKTVSAKIAVMQAFQPKRKESKT